MPRYTIEQQILTLAEIMVDYSTQEIPVFSVEDIEFAQWDFSLADGCIENKWVAKAEIESLNYHEAYKIFFDKLRRIIPRLSLVTQCYINFLDQPFLITKEDRGIGFFRYSSLQNPVGLGFCEQQMTGLNRLLEEDSIPEEFYYHWNDAVNVSSYPAKMLSMCAAIEAITKSNKGMLRKKILGKELRDDLFAQITGLRHRLSHGEYFDEMDTGIDYAEKIHKKIIKHFNEDILEENLLTEDVVAPQRHPEGGRAMGNYFIKRRDETSLLFRGIVGDCEENAWGSFVDHTLTSEPESF